ncbi:hypothetical protein ACFB49_25850 [Sphingomonas sp. DBB INV C78]
MLRGDCAALLDELRSISGNGFAYAVEATGLPGVMASAATCLRKTGEVVLLGVPASREIPFPSSIMRGATIHTCVEGDSNPHEMIPRLIDLHHSGDFPFEKMIKTFDFTNINAAVEAMKDGSVIKPVLLIGEEAA